MNIKKIFLVLIFSLISFGCTNNKEELSEKVNSNINKNSIVSLTSLTSDIIYNLNSEYLVGIPQSSILMKNDELKNITKISQGRNPPNIEKIISLNPKLVIGSAGFHDKTLSKLDELGIKTLKTKVNSWSDLISLIEQLTAITNGNKDQIFNKLNYCIIEPSLKDKQVVVLVSTKPLLAPNSDSWAGSLLEKFNLKNLTSGLESSGRLKGYLNLSPEWLLKNDPDNLILIKFGNEQYNQYNSLPFWNSLKAVKNDNVSYFNYYGLINVGSLDSINKTCQRLESL